MTSRRYYYWLVAKEEITGKPYLIFGGLSEEECRQKGLEMLSGLDFEIKRYPTRDLATASAFFRGVRLEETHSLRQAGRRIGHDKSLRIRDRQRARRTL